MTLINCWLALQRGRYGSDLGIQPCPLKTGALRPRDGQHGQRAPGRPQMQGLHPPLSYTLDPVFMPPQQDANHPIPAGRAPHSERGTCLLLPFFLKSLQSQQRHFGGSSATRLLSLTSKGGWEGARGRQRHTGGPHSAAPSDPGVLIMDVTHGRCSVNSS